MHYIPGVFKCELPASLSVGYDVSGCQASTNNKISMAECQVECDSSTHKKVPGFAVTGVCSPELGKTEGFFDLVGCYEKELSR